MAAAALSVLVLSLGCVKVRSSYALLSQPKEAHSGDVALLVEGQPIPANLHEVALVQAVGIKPDGDEDKVRSRLIDQSRALGCTAVGNVRVDRSDGSTGISGVCLAP
jgi:hypothetical protein